MRSSKLAAFGPWNPRSSVETVKQQRWHCTAHGLVDTMPSTSPANASYSLKRKIEAWRAIAIALEVPQERRRL